MLYLETCSSTPLYILIVTVVYVSINAPPGTLCSFCSGFISKKLYPLVVTFPSLSYLSKSSVLIYNSSLFSFVESIYLIVVLTTFFVPSSYVKSSSSSFPISSILLESFPKIMSHFVLSMLHDTYLIPLLSIRSLFIILDILDEYTIMSLSSCITVYVFLSCIKDDSNDTITTLTSTTLTITSINVNPFLFILITYYI